MEVKGKIIRVYPAQSGSGRQGTWVKQEFILEMPGKKVCLQVWGKDLVDKYDLDSAAGIEVTAYINIESREYNGRWYTDCRCWKLEWDQQQRRNWTPGGDGLKGAPAHYDLPELPSNSLDAEFSNTDDLPF